MEQNKNKTYLVTLEVTCDPSEPIGMGMTVGHPTRWNYTQLLGVEYATCLTAYEVCCEEKRDWVAQSEEDRMEPFYDEWHDEKCPNYVAIDEGEDDEDELLGVIFGDTTSEVK